MTPTPELIDALYLDKVRAAREMGVEDKLSAGVELFEYVCRIMRSGIRHQHPEFTDPEVEQLLAKRLELARWLERHPI